MKLSTSFVKTSKSVAGDLESKNARLLTQGGFIKQEIAGVYIYLTLGLRVLNNIEHIVRSEMQKVGMEVLLPALSSKRNWEITKRIDKIDVLFKASGANKASSERNDTEYILNPTHEDIVTPLVQSYASSYKDLPVAVFQIQTKFRNEARSKSGLLRGREFRMKDLYSFHASQEDLLSFYEKMRMHYTAIYETLGLGDETFYTYASGGDFTSGFSNEFQTLLETGEDTIYLDREKKVAYNEEIVNDENAKKLHVDFSSLQVVRASEVGNIFPLNTRFSEAFDYYCTDENGEKKIIYMGSYGIGTSRLMGVIAEKFSDEKGLVWPDAVAPFKYHLITLHGDNTKTVSEKIYMNLGESVCLWDDRDDMSAGEKFSDADLIGCPVQIIVSPRNLANQEVEIRSRSGAFAQFTLPIKDIARLEEEVEKHKESA